MTSGFIGNILVLHVFHLKFKKTSSNYFILSLAVFDLFTCTVGMPTEIYDMLYSYTFYSAAGCKLLRFAETVSTFGSVFILVAMACDRYVKICLPMKIVELFKIKIICFATLVGGLAMSAPTLFVYGIRVVNVTHGIMGADCSLEEEYTNSMFFVVYFQSLMAMFAVSLLIMIGLYIRIGVEIRRRQQRMIGERVSRKPDVIPNSREYRIKYLPSISNDDSQLVDTHSLKEEHKKCLRKISRSQSIVQKIKASRSTVILFTVTVAFVVSFLPSVAITSIRSLKDGTALSLELDFVRKLFYRFYFINSAINPVIYSFLNPDFRKECIKILRKCFSCGQSARKEQFRSSRSSTSS